MKFPIALISQYYEFRVKQQSLIITCSRSDVDFGSSAKTTDWADEKLSPTPPAVNPMIAILTCKIYT